MSSHGTEQLTLFTDLHLKQDILSEVYSHLGLRNEPNKDFLAMSPTRTLKNKIYSFTYVPDYMDTVMAHTDKQTQKRYPSVYGYAIDLKNCNEVDDYMRTHLNKRRKSIARSVRRLEQSFETSYKMYLGDMDVDQYHFLMGRLKSMITQRFKQKGHESDNLAVWDKVLSTSLGLIRAKKASLFVIYVKDEPIVISFNYNYGPVLFSSVTYPHMTLIMASSALAKWRFTNNWSGVWPMDIINLIWVGEEWAISSGGPTKDTGFITIYYILSTHSRACSMPCGKGTSPKS